MAGLKVDNKDDRENQLKDPNLPSDKWIGWKLQAAEKTGWSSLPPERIEQILKYADETQPIDRLRAKLALACLKQKPNLALEG